MSSPLVVGPGTRVKNLVLNDFGTLYAALAAGAVVYVAIGRLVAGNPFNVLGQLAMETVWLSVYVLLTWARFRREGAAFWRQWAPLQSRPAHVSRLRYWLIGRGGTQSLYIVAIASTFGVFSAAVILPRSEAYGAGIATTIELLSTTTVAASWVAAQVAFAVHYAKTFYRDAAGMAGLDFPGATEPTYQDFLYLAMSIGTTLGTTDVAVTSSAMRRRVLAHMLLAFVFNTVILAIVLAFITR